MTPKTTLNPKVLKVIKTLQSSFNENVNKILEQAEHEKSANENLNVLIDLATIAMVIEDK